MTGVSLGRRGRIVGVGAGLAVAVAGVGVGAAYASSGSSAGAAAGAASTAAVQRVADSTTPPAGQAPKAPGDHHRPPMRDRALRLGAAVEHGELVVKAKEGGTRTVSVQHGKVTDVSAGSLTVTSEDGFSWSYVLDDKTHVRKDGQKATVSDLAKDDDVRVFAVVDGDKREARLVIDGHPQRPMRPGAPGAPAGPDQGQAPTAPGATPSGLDDLSGLDVLGA